MPAAYQSFLPPYLADEPVKACLGLISDTHMPVRCAELPPALSELFRDVDLILHAGDVGELWVLDQLSQIAPVIAVYGNDETVDAQRELPYQQLISVGGQRIVLCHSHYPDRALEFAMRKDDTWHPKLDRLLDFGRRAGASMVVFGHSHIPMTFLHDDILLINPGAVASGSAVERQLHRTAALLYIFEKRQPLVIHLDLDNPPQIHVPNIDWSAGFRAALRKYSASIIDPTLADIWPPWEKQIRNLLIDPNDRVIFDAIYGRVLPIARRCWADDSVLITRADLVSLLNEITSDPQVPTQVLSDLRAALG